MAKKGGGFAQIFAAAGAMQDIGKRGVQTSYLYQAGMQKVMQQIGEEARAVAAASGPKGKRKKPKFDRAPKGRKWAFVPSGQMRVRRNYSYIVPKRPMGVVVVAGTGFRGYGIESPMKRYVARHSTFVGNGIRYGGGGSPGRMLRVLGNVSWVGKRKGRKRVGTKNNWIERPVFNAANKRRKELVGAYNDAIRRRIERATRSGRI